MHNSIRVLSCLFTIGATAALAQPAPNSVEVVDFAHGGSGCPQGAGTETVLSADRKTLTIEFTDLVARVGPRTELSESRSHCNLAIGIKVPQGWSYSLATVDFFGSAYLERGVTGLQKATYYFSDETKETTAETRFTGATWGNYHFRDTVGFGKLESGCGGYHIANIKTQVRLDNSANPQGRGRLSVDTISGKVKQVYHLTWKQCK